MYQGDYPGFQDALIRDSVVPIDKTTPAKQIPIGGKFKVVKECNRYASGEGPPPAERMKIGDHTDSKDHKPRNAVVLEGERKGQTDHVPDEVRVIKI